MEISETVSYFYRFPPDFSKLPIEGEAKLTGKNTYIHILQQKQNKKNHFRFSFKNERQMSESSIHYQITK